MMDDVDLPQSDQLDGAPHPAETVHLLGQAPAETEFLAAYNSARFHHAWLMTGPRGVGKATLAWKIAKFLLTQPVSTAGGLFGDDAPAPTDLSTDPNHPVVRRMMAGAEAGLCVIRRPYDDKRKQFKSQITVDEVRKLRNFFALSAADGGRRVVIVDAADDMNVNAANALLKVLEEPPANTTLLLICHQPSRILPTIRSRCRTLRLSELPADLVQQALTQADIDLDPAQTRVTTALSSGSVGDAIRMSSTHGAQVYLGLLGLIGQAPQMDRDKVLSFANAYAGKSASDDFETLIAMVEILIARLARSGATGQPLAQTVSDQEFEIFQKLCPTPALARKWADLNHEISSRLRHGRAVNLDPVSMILDTLFKVEECAARA